MDSTSLNYPSNLAKRIARCDHWFSWACGPMFKDNFLPKYYTCRHFHTKSCIVRGQSTSLILGRPMLWGDPWIYPQSSGDIPNDQQIVVQGSFVSPRVKRVKTVPEFSAKRPCVCQDSTFTLWDHNHCEWIRCHLPSLQCSSSYYSLSGGKSESRGDGTIMQLIIPHPHGSRKHYQQSIQGYVAE